MSSIATAPDGVSRHRLFERHIAPRDSWDRGRIVAAVRAWYEEAGEVPRSYDWCPSSGRSLGRFVGTATKWELEHPRWPGSTTVYRYFDSWAEAVEAAGLTPRYAAKTMPLPERVQATQRLGAHGLTLREIASAVGVSEQTARRYLQAHPCADCAGPVIGGGSLCQPCSTRASNPRRWDREELLGLGAAWLLETGRLPCQLDWSPAKEADDSKWRQEFPRWPPASVVVFAFGGWNPFRVALGGEEYHPAWTADEVLDAIRAWAAEHGRPPTKTEWECPPRGYPSSPTVRRRFGTFRAGLQAAGYESPKPSWSRATLIDAIHHFEDKHCRPPQRVDWRKAPPGEPNAVTVLKHFGSWEAALAAADEAREVAAG